MKRNAPESNNPEMIKTHLNDGPLYIKSCKVVTSTRPFPLLPPSPPPPSLFYPLAFSVLRRPLLRFIHIKKYLTQKIYNFLYNHQLSYEIRPPNGLLPCCPLLCFLLPYSFTCLPSPLHPPPLSAAFLPPCYPLFLTNNTVLGRIVKSWFFSFAE